MEKLTNLGYLHVRSWRISPNATSQEIRRELHDVRKTEVRNVIVICSSPLTFQIMEQVKCSINIFVIRTLRTMNIL